MKTYKNQLETFDLPTYELKSTGKGEIIILMSLNGKTSKIAEVTHDGENVIVLARGKDLINYFNRDYHDILRKAINFINAYVNKQRWHEEE